MKPHRLVTKPAGMAVHYTWRTALRMAAATAFGCLFGWWWDRPGLVRDKAMESPFERRAQYCAVLFWPPLVLWLTASAPGAPRWLSGLAEWTPLGTLHAWVWGVLMTPFACLVIARRVMASHGRPWRLRRLVRDLLTWAALHRVVVGLPAGFSLLLVGRWATGHTPTFAAAYGIPGALAMVLTLVAAERHAAFLRKTDRLNGRLSRVLGVTESAMKEQAVYAPGRNGDIILTHFPAAAIDHIDDDFDTRVVEHFGFGSSIDRDPDPATGLVRRFVLRSTIDLETALNRQVRENTRGLVVRLEDGADLPHRPGHRVAHLHPSVGPSAASDVDTVLKAAYGLRVVEWRPDERVAYCAELRPRTAELREAIRRQLKAKYPWEVEIGVKADLTGPRVVKVYRSPDGAAEQRVETWKATVAALSSSPLMTLGDGERWSVVDDPASGMLDLIRECDPLVEVQPYPWDTCPTMHAIPFAVAEDGTPMTLGLLEVNQLLGGVPGGGKSGGITALLCGIARLSNVALIGLDPKKVELAPWRRRFTRIATTEDQATDVLQRLVVEMESRYDWLEQHGKKKFTADMFNTAQPLLVVVIDELADLVSVAVEKEEKAEEAARATMIRRLIAKGRAAGVVVIAATQKPQSDVVPTALRDMIQLRVGYATTNAAMTDTILGAGMAQNGGLSHEIAATLRGCCFVVNETSRTPVRARTYWLPDDQVEGIAKSTSHLRVPLGWLEVGSTAASTATITEVTAPAAEVQTEVVDFSLADLDAFIDDADTTDDGVGPVPVPPVPASLWD